MPATRTYKTPGVYVAELSAFPPSVVGVPTAVPAFIGYTQTAEVNGKPVLFKPVPITSLAAFEQYFGGAYKAVYDIVDGTEANYDFRVWDPKATVPQFRYYKLQSAQSFNLYNSMRLFYANGGGNCYVVSVGLYETTTVKDKVNGATTTKEEVTTVAKVEKDPLLKGLAAAKEQVGPTMLVIPDAVLLPATPPETPPGGTPPKKQPWVSGDFAEVTKAMLMQCALLQDRVAVLDVYGTEYLSEPAAADAETPDLTTVITQFRSDVGSVGLNYGMAYFPFLDTTVVPLSGADYTTLDNTVPEGSPAGTPGALEQILLWENQNLYGDPDVAVNKRAQQVRDDILKIPTTQPNNSTPAQIRKLNDNLTAALPLLVEMERQVVNQEDVLPPSAAMAGIMAYVDGTRGVWNAPANQSLSGVAKPTYPLNNDQQADLNLPVDGKAVDALRVFPGRGTVVWGARTLDGNSNDYRYIQVRRTLIYIEQSIKNALNPFVFAPNTGQTWTSVVAMVSAFLQTLWSQGGLMGATAAEAFTVQCGVGSTMTGQDVLDGYMIVQVTLQLIRPAEFIELTFKQKMEGVA